MRRHIREGRVNGHGALFDRCDHDGNGVITRLELAHTLDVRA